MADDLSKDVILSFLVNAKTGAEVRLFAIADLTYKSMSVPTQENVTMAFIMIDDTVQRMVGHETKLKSSESQRYDVNLSLTIGGQVTKAFSWVDVSYRVLMAVEHAVMDTLYGLTKMGSEYAKKKGLHPLGHGPLEKMKHIKDKM